MQESSAESRMSQRRFAIASAAYNVARYLPDFIGSIERQSFGLDSLEVIVVDDGSTDDTLSVLTAWSERRPDLVTVLSKPNGGQASARNMALDHVTAEWVTFLDPDDWVDDDYLRTVANFIDDHHDVQLVGTYRIFFDEQPDGSGALRDGHPLRHLFRGEDKAVDLDAYPDYFHGSVPSAFLRTDRIAAEGLRFDTRIRPNFEDGAFCARYLLIDDAPVIGLISSARYYYRKRADLSSTLQNSLVRPERFTDVPRFGYLALLRDAAARYGRAPTWVQNMILYELSWYFSSDESATAAATAATGQVGREYVRLLAEIKVYIDDEVVNSHTMRRYKQLWRDILLHATGTGDWHTPYVVLQKLDPRRREVRLTFRYVGERPVERFLMRGLEVEPLHEKVRTIEYFGTAVMFERIVWVRLEGTIRVQLNGVDVELLDDWRDTSAVTSLRPSALRDLLSVTTPARRGRREQYLGAPRRLAGRARRFLRGALSYVSPEEIARSWFVRRRYRGAWVVMDRIRDANDSGEILFRFLVETRPDVKAFFVLQEGTSDWRRLSRAFPKDRLVSYGSRRWKHLMLNCQVVISSHVDAPIHAPRPITLQRAERWKFVFLQHGVIKDDLSRWLNPKDLDLFVTSTPDEYDSIQADMTPYIYTSKEVRLTGLPRFDALREAADRVAHEPRDLVLIAPTWRQWLNQLRPDGSPRDESAEPFLASEFAENWLAVINSPVLAERAAAAGLRIALLPHPNIIPAVPHLGLPRSVEVLEYSDNRLHENFARAAVLITDYSSMAFNAAYLDRPVVYFQFDHVAVALGGHLGRAGYFDYSTKGFGPVVYDRDAAIEALCTTIAAGGKSADIYRRRAERAFIHRDGKCTERVVDEIEGIL